MALTLPAGQRLKQRCVAAAGSKIGLDFAAEESVHTDVTSSIIASAWPFGWAVGGGSAGIWSVQHDGGSHVQNVIPNRQA
jgi:hypothetical protein